MQFYHTNDLVKILAGSPSTGTPNAAELGKNRRL